MLLSYKKEIRTIFPTTLESREYGGVSNDILNNCYIERTYNAANQIISSLHFINMHAYKLSMPLNPEFVYQVDIVKSKSGVTDAVVFNLDIEDLLELQAIRTMPFSFLYSFNCDIKKFYVRADYLRKARKAKSILETINNPDKKDIRKGLDLYYKMNFACSTAGLSYIDKIINFYSSNNHAISIICYKESEIVGIMLGFLWEKTAFMHMHYFNPLYTNCYISDFLYQEFIAKSKEKGVEKVFWGDVSPKDMGLYVFKKHYSTAISKKYICVL